MSLMLSHRQAFTGGACSTDAAISPARAIYSASVAMPGDLAREKYLEVHLAASDADRALAGTLLNRMYDWRGYGNGHAIPVSDHHTTFLASLDGRTVGTITLAVDTGEGLAADAIFHDEIATFRRVPGASVCELIKFAFDAEMPSRKLLASLFHIVFIYGKRRHSCTDLFIEVNPRHRRFYEAMLGFQPVGPLRINPSVGAPSQLMWLKVSDIAARIRAYAGRTDSMSSRSLYPLFLSQSDVSTVGHCLADHMNA